MKILAIGHQSENVWLEIRFLQVPWCLYLVPVFLLHFFEEVADIAVFGMV